MINDYKGVDLSLKKKRIKTIRILFVLLILIIIYLFFSNNVDNKKIITIQKLLLQNKAKEASIIYDKIKISFYHRTSKEILKGIFELYAENYDDAITIFNTINDKESLIEHNKFILHFLEKVKYKEMNIYLDFLGIDFKQYNYYKALYATAMFKYEESESFLKRIKVDIDNDLKNEISKIITINRKLKTNKFNYIFDINGMPLAYYDLLLKKTIAVKSFKGFNFDTFTNTINNGIRIFTLTFNNKTQNIIHKIFNKYKLNGSFILLKTEDNSIISAYSRNTNNKNTVFSKHYEPGSIVKILTLYGYFKNNIKNIFPYECRSLNIDNTAFYDWISHGHVSSYEQALAWSCNIGFAKIGIKLGLEKLTKSYTDFLFNRKDIQDNFLKFDMGTFMPENIDNNYDLAKVSVGLSVFNKDSRKDAKNLITMTTIHSALLSSSIANKGIINSPFLIKNIKSITNIGAYNHNDLQIQNINAPLIFNKIANAMIRVIKDKNGTGKNSFVDFVNMALKTGTAGKKKPYNAILTGFFPSNRPKYAFAFILEHSGPSKNKGAKFLKDFIKDFYNKGQ